jgi:hypothetical protein
MTATQLAKLCLHLAAALVLVGLFLATFVGARGIGMVVAILGLVSYGGYIVCSYLHWEHGE